MESLNDAIELYLMPCQDHKRSVGHQNSDIGLGLTTRSMFIFDKKKILTIGLAGLPFLGSDQRVGYHDILIPPSQPVASRNTEAEFCKFLRGYPGDPRFSFADITPVSSVFFGMHRCVGKVGMFEC